MSNTYTDLSIYGNVPGYSNGGPAGGEMRLDYTVRSGDTPTENLSVEFRIWTREQYLTANGEATDYMRENSPTGTQDWSLFSAKMAELQEERAYSFLVVDDISTQLSPQFRDWMTMEEMAGVEGSATISYDDFLRHLKTAEMESNDLIFNVVVSGPEGFVETAVPGSGSVQGNSSGGQIKFNHTPDFTNVQPFETVEPVADQAAEDDAQDVPGFVISENHAGSVTFLGETADHRNSLGMYEIAEDGSIQNVTFLFANASAQGSGGDLIVGGSSVDINFAAGTKVGFFILPDGARQNSAELLQTGAENDGVYEFRDSFGNVVNAMHEGPTYLWLVNRDGGETKLSTSAYDVTWHSTGPDGQGANLNGDGLNHVRFELAVSDNRIVLEMGFEDLWNGGDHDYDDVMFRLDMGVTNVNMPIPEEISNPPAPAPLADLTISSIEGSAEALAAGEDLIVEVTVENQGDAGADGVRTSYFWSATDSFDRDTAVKVDADNHGSMRAGEVESGESERIRYEDIAHLGDGYIFGVVDADGEIAESNETNNVSDALAVRFESAESIADLTIDSLSLRDSSLDAGQDMLVSMSVSNSGSALARSTNTTVYWSATEAYNEETAVAIGRDSHGTLSAGETDGDEGLRIRYETLAGLGDGYIIAKIDPRDAVAESDETNNLSNAVAFSVDDLVRGQADLTIDAMTVRDTLLEDGQDLNIRLAVSNIGDAGAASTRSTYYWSATEIFDENTAVLLDTDSHGRLRAGESADEEYESISYDSFAALGDGYVFAMIDAEGLVDESREDNNLSGPVAITVSRPDNADLVIEQTVLSSDRLGDGDDVFIYLDVSNNGETDVNSARTTLFWNPTAVFDRETAIAIDSDHHGLLRAGETETEERTRLRYEDLEELGDGYVFGVIDNGGAAEETDEGNNVGEGQFFYLPGADNTLTGTPDADVLDGEGGNDAITGLGGDDSLNGGRGDDTVFGGDGDDSIDGGHGNDSLSGDAHADRLTGGAGDDHMSGGAGRDVFVFAAGHDADTVVDFEMGMDQIEIQGTDFAGLSITDAAGDALVIWAGGQIVLTGVSAGDLLETDFVFV